MPRQFACPKCSFMVRSENNNEVIELVQNHADKHHGMDLSEDDVRSGWENAEMEAQD